MNENDLISRAAAIDAIRETWQLVNRFAKPYDLTRVVECIKAIKQLPSVNAVPVEWLNERHRKCCEEGDTDLMDAITVLCNEYHVWQEEQEAR